jgi:2-isopropylmalate synthase
MPWDVAAITRIVVDRFDNVTVGIHAHNDCGMAVANSIIAAKNGAGLIQGTINGVGERTGNANLCSIVPSLALHVNSKMSCRHNLKEMTNLSRFVDETMNRQPDPSAPYVGASAFAHKGGLHVAAMERSPMSYQHIDPSLVGNEKRILISELSGRQNIIGKIKGLLSMDGSVTEEIASERAVAILNRVKQLENIGYTFEGAEASVDLMILHSTKEYCIPFRVIDYSVQVFDSDLDPAYRSLDQSAARMGRKLGPTARATVQLRTASVVCLVIHYGLGVE